MTTLARRVIYGLAAAVVLIVACVVVYVKLRPHGPPGVPPELVHVPVSWAQYRATPGHQTHVGGGKAECRDCHDFDSNGFKNPGTRVCTRCHTHEAAGAHHGPGSGSGECLTCHTFAPEDTVTTCIDCHRSPQGGLPAIVHHATVDCSTCHHLAQTPSLVLADCTGCHDKIELKHQTMGPSRNPGSHGCVDCHHGHEPASAAKTVCTSCHNENKLPHPRGHDACTSCHVPHDFAARDGACIGCHGHKRTLADRVVPAHGVCINCHNPHVPGSAASACAGCHWNMQVTSHGKEKACTSCHALHGDDPHSVGGPDAGLVHILRDFGK
ncbi:MAG: hypothetical protein ABI321_06130 [Polyangia bacterium]